MHWKQIILDSINFPLAHLGARLVPARDHTRMQAFHSMVNSMNFTLGSVEFAQFAHKYNCGWPYLASHTERSVELAVADRWLDLVSQDQVTEIGAVTPYYWPRRIVDIVDPTDEHPLVARHDGIENINLTGRAILSISTFEHIGRGDYEQGVDPPAAGRALDKLLEEADCFLVTFPTGYNSWLDEHILDRTDIHVRLLVRNTSGIGWRETPPHRDHLRPYSSTGGQGVFFLHRGTNLFKEL